MTIRSRWRLWRAKTVPAPALLTAFVVGAVASVPPTLWLGVGRREVIRVVQSPAPGMALGTAPARVSGAVRPGVAQTSAVTTRGLTSVLRQSLRDIQRWENPSSTGRRVEEFLASQTAAGPGGASRSSYLAPGCASPAVMAALDRQLAIQTTIKRSRLAVDAFGTRAFAAIAKAASAAVGCLDGALARVSDESLPERVEFVRLLARLGPSQAPLERAKAAFQREASRTVSADTAAAPGPVYALHAYLAVEKDLSTVGDTVRKAVRAQRDPAVQAALREVVSRRFSGLLTSWAM